MTNKSLRVFVGALVHETNSFSPIPTTVRSFEEGELCRPDDASKNERVQRFPGYGDALAIAAESGDEVVRGTCAWAQPSGPVSRLAYEALRDEVLTQLREGGGVDAVFLVLHGAMMADGYPDCEGDILQKAREIVGPEVPIGALLDLHGNMSQAMIDSGALIVACKEYPHTDYLPRARELYRLLATVARGGAMPRTTLKRVPMMAMLGTTVSPMFEFVRRLEACEGSKGILSVSAMHGFAWSDTAETGASMVIVSDPTAEGLQSAHQLATELARELFDLKERGAKRLPLDEALDVALADPSARGPVVMSDGSDNAGGGASSDSTFVLDALLQRGVRNVALGMIWDPQAVLKAADAGVGARISIRIGGKVGSMSGRPIDVVAEVIAVRDDANQVGLGGQWKVPLGLAVSLRFEGIEVVLNSIRSQVFYPECFTEMGIDLSTKRLIVVKSSQHFREGFDPIASSTVYCNAPGTLNQDLSALPYQHLKRPIWPLDSIALGDT